MRARSISVALLPALAAVLALPGSAAAAPKDEGRAAAALGTARLDATDAGTVSPEVLAAAGRLIVKFDDDVSARTEASVLRSADADVDEQVAPLDLSVVEVAPRDAAQAEATLEASPHVEYVERDAVVRSLAAPNDALWSNQWGLQLLDLPYVWEAANRGAIVSVAVLDTGIDAGHPDLAGLVGAGIDIVNGDADATDDHGHGTAAAGVIAARGDNALGGAGICRTCSLLPVKVLDRGGAGTTSMVAEGIVWAVDRGARVINLSLGSPTPTQSLRDAIAYASSRGVILVAAAGNEGTSDPIYPAADAGVVSVAATMPDDALYEWSNRGAWVRLAAPGCNVAPGLGGDFVSFCGTSSAAPIVAGLAGMAVAQEPGAGQARIEAALGAGAVPVPHVARGRINAREVLTALGVAVQPEPRVIPSASRFVRSSLTTRTPVRRFTQRIGKGSLRVVVRSATRGLALSVLDGRGRVVGRASGGRVLAATKPLPAGTYRIVVRGRAGARFNVSVTYPRTPKEVSAWLARTRT